jgi:coenzyme PQQ precursor peptide PqqA
VSGASSVDPAHNNRGDTRMAWKAPKVVEVALGGEINSYVCARLK